MENPTNSNQPAEQQEEVKQETTQAVAETAAGEERKLGEEGEEEKKGEGKLLASRGPKKPTVETERASFWSQFCAKSITNRRPMENYA